jgi:hypothetical protein
MSVKPIFTKYLKELSAVAQQGDAREESFYPALAEMLKAIADATGRSDVHVTTLPKPTDAGNPDFRLWNGTDRIIGYIEAKKPSEERLDVIEESEQLKRYRSTFPNLILTNFLEFRLYRNGERVETVLAARPMVLNRLRMTPPIEKPDELDALLGRFLDFSLPKVFTAESLAVELAKRTRFLRDAVALQLQQEKDAPGDLVGFFEAFHTYLIGTLTQEDFADLFAQTITYGLFAIRNRAGDQFNRRTAFDNIPRTIGVLRELFRYISSGDLPEQLAWCIDAIAEVLAVADAPGILDRYYRDGKGGDPIIAFYETFLAQYDPAERERRGVYYTPESVVGYIVRSLHELLKTEFNKPDGLASEGVTLLDPAAGTMTFVARAAQLAVAEFEAKYGAGGREDFIRHHILKNFYAFELMMAPYAIGHLKMGFFLEELGHRLTDDERVPFYLTNTLDNEELERSRFPGFSALAEESRLAGAVKKQTPILVILGNPPYSGHSSNMGAWIRGLIEDYKKDAPELKRPAQAKWLQDDYVKFLRFSQWKIEQAGRGVVGMITNHSYLDNPTFRGMRQNLMRTFDEIYVLDLHGNSLKKETCPDGSPDQNVFDIRQGVAIAFFIKRGDGSPDSTIIHHADRWDQRERKYEWLEAHDITSTQWQLIAPGPRFFQFKPTNETLQRTYEQFLSVTQVFSENGTPAPGIVTTQDQFAISWTHEEANRKVQILLQTRSESEARMIWRLCSQNQWNYERAKRELADGVWRDQVVKILYRPFDIRWTVYNPNVAVHRRERVMRHMLAGENLALIVMRQVSLDEPYTHVLATKQIVDNRTFVSSKGITTELPLYLYPTADRADLFANHEPSERRPNLNPTVVSALAQAYGKEPRPEDIFHYIYAVLYVPAYRLKYAEFLRMDFPRVPFTADVALFGKLAALGARLTALHLLTSPELDPPACRFEGVGDSRVGKGRTVGLRYDGGENRVYINATQYFAPVPEAVWSYQAGGYQVCQKWLKDRQERRLELDDIRTYCRIVTALGLTLDIQQQLDLLYPDVEKDVVTIPG